MSDPSNPPWGIIYDTQLVKWYYVNALNRMQNTRIANIVNWYFECVVFPGQRLLFVALPEAELEIYTHLMPNTILCDRLQVSE